MWFVTRASRAWHQQHICPRGEAAVSTKPLPGNALFHSPHAILPRNSAELNTSAAAAVCCAVLYAVLYAVPRCAGCWARSCCGLWWSRLDACAGWWRLRAGTSAGRSHPLQTSRWCASMQTAAAHVTCWWLCVQTAPSLAAVGVALTEQTGRVGNGGAVGVGWGSLGA